MAAKTSSQTLDRVGWIALFGGLLTLVGRRFVPLTDAKMQTLVEQLTYAGIGIAIIGFLLIVVANRQAIAKALRTRQAKYGANSLALTLSVIGIIVLVNYLGSRYQWRFDLTEAKTFTISEQSKKILDSLDGPVTITAYYQDNNPSRQQVKDLLSNYEYASKQLKISFVDPDKQPALAQQHGIERYGTTIFQKGDRTEKVTSFSEQDFTSALIKLVKNKETKVYFVEGHGELSLEEFGDKGISRIKDALGKDHYQTEALSLPAKQEVPADADVVVIAGPQHPYAAKEVELLDTYLKKGGKLLVMVSPGVNAGLDGLLTTYGISFGNDLVIDPVSRAWTDLATPAVTRYRWHEITKSLNGVTTFFPRSRSVSLAENQPDGQLGSVLAETTAAGWGETDLANPDVAFDAGKDKQGPVGLGVAVSKDAAEGPKSPDADKPVQTRLVVFGNAAFVSNGVLNQAAANADLALNAINWLAQEEALIAIRPKPPQQRTITLTNQQMGTIFTGVVAGLPLAMLALGTFIWYRRR